MHLGIEFVLEDVQVVGGGDGDDVLVRVPRRVEDLLGEVQAVHTDVVLPALPPGSADPPRLQDGSGFAALPRRLQGHVAFGVPVEHAEEVVVRSCHDHAGRERRRGLQLQHGGHTTTWALFSAIRLTRTVTGLIVQTQHESCALTTPVLHLTIFYFMLIFMTCFHSWKKCIY